MAEVSRELHAPLGARFFEFEGHTLPESYGDPVAEHLAVRARVGVVDRSHRSRVRIGGGERVTFLQRLLSNDIAGLAEGSWALAALLTPKGKLIADLTVLHRGDHFLLDYAPALREEIVRKLTMYVLSSDVVVEDVAGGTGLISLHGPGAEALLSGLGVNELPVGLRSVISAEVAGRPASICRVDDLGETGFDLFVDADSVGPVFSAATAAGAVPVGQAAVETLRIEAGRWRYGAELDSDLLPPEVPLFGQRAISYTKGCFVGQETIARIKTYGHVNRELRGLVILGAEPPAPGTDLHFGEKTAGTITSSCVAPGHDQPIALGFVKRAHLETGTRLVLDGGGEAVVVPAGGPWRA